MWILFVLIIGLLLSASSGAAIASAVGLPTQGQWNAVAVGVMVYLAVLTVVFLRAFLAGEIKE